MMTEVHTVSIVAKNMYSGKSGRPAPPDQRRNEGQETVDQGHNGTRR